MNLFRVYTLLAVVNLLVGVGSAQLNEDWETFDEAGRKSGRALG